MASSTPESSVRFVAGFGLLAGSFLAGLSFFLLMAARVGAGSGGAEILMSAFFLAAAASWMRRFGRPLLGALVIVWMAIFGWKLYQLSLFSQCRANILEIDAAVSRYVADQPSPPARLADLIDRYLPRLPECPVAGRDTYSDGYDVAPRRIWCSGTNHPGYGPVDHPALIAVPDSLSPSASPTMRWASPSRNVSSSI